MFQVRGFDIAYRVLTAEGAFTPLTQFYAGLAAWQGQHYEVALRHASLSYASFSFAPSAAVAALASFELGHRDRGRAWIERMNREGLAAGPEWVELFTDLPWRAREAGFWDVLEGLDSGLAKIAQQAETKLLAIEASGARRRQLKELWHEGEFGQLSSMLDPADGTLPTDPLEAAAFAGALAHLRDDRAASVAAAAAELQGARFERRAAGFLVKAFANPGRCRGLRSVGRGRVKCGVSGNGVGAL